MARRGRFGRSETGASNLSATIRQLVAEQQAAEEKALMDAFYNGMEYNGSIPTMDDVRAFYAKWVDITGLTPGDADWQIINQKIEGANNFDIQRTYKDLEATFSSTNGSNYDELVGFLNGRAKESTDQQDMNTFEQAFGVIVNNYIVYRANDLRDGIIKTASEYRRIVDEAIANIDPSNPIRDSIIATSFAEQWKYMNNKKQNLLAIGKISVSQYASWAKEFAGTIVAAGLDKRNSTYLEALASAANISGRGGGSGGPGSQRLNDTTAKLSEIWSLVKAQFGGQESGFFPGESQTTSEV